MRTLAIGDIHGCSRALDALLEFVDPQLGDTVVTLGDYVDRGPDSKGVLDRLITLRDRCRHVPLKGNHDLMMLDSLNAPECFAKWLPSGGSQTLASYQGPEDWRSLTEVVPAEHWRYLQTDCLPYFETDTHLFVHANVDPDRPLAEQTDDWLYWEKLGGSWWKPHGSGKTMVCGHTAQRSGRPLVLDRAVCIDTWAYGDGWLTCLDVEQELYWQANERGQTRLGNLLFRR